jgi:hypothetical protein
LIPLVPAFINILASGFSAPFQISALPLNVCDNKTGEKNNNVFKYKYFNILLI